MTMQAYENPAFVEDIARDAAVALRADDPRVARSRSRVTNQESIHSHNAVATVRGRRERDRHARSDSRARVISSSDARGVKTSVARMSRGDADAQPLRGAALPRPAAHPSHARGATTAREAGRHVDVSIVSAGHGLVARPRPRIAPYERTFQGMSSRRAPALARRAAVSHATVRRVPRAPTLTSPSSCSATTTSTHADSADDLALGRPQSLSAASIGRPCDCRRSPRAASRSSLHASDTRRFALRSSWGSRARSAGRLLAHLRRDVRRRRSRPTSSCSRRWLARRRTAPPLAAAERGSSDDAVLLPRQPGPDRSELRLRDRGALAVPHPPARRPLRTRGPRPAALLRACSSRRRWSMASTAARARYSAQQRQRLYRVGIREFFRLDACAGPRSTTMGDCGAFTYVREEDAAVQRRRGHRLLRGLRLRRRPVARPRDPRLRPATRR